MAQIKKGEKRTKKQQQEAVLAAFTDCANITISCKKAKVPRRTFYNWLEDEDFKDKFEKCVKIAIGVLEDEARRRAIVGVDKPVYYQGRRVGRVREYSDTLLIVLLKAHAPEKYKDRVASELTGFNGGPIQTENTKVHFYLPQNGRNTDDPSAKDN